MKSVEESRNPAKLNQVTTRFDNVIRVVKDHEKDSHQLQQATEDMQQAVESLKQTLMHETMIITHNNRSPTKLQWVLFTETHFDQPILHHLKNHRKKRK